MFLQYLDGETLYVTAKDAAGNESNPREAEAPYKLFVDATVDPLGTTVSGQTKPGATVEVSNPEGVLGTATADADGNYEITLQTPQIKGELLTVIATNNGVEASTKVEAPIINDTTDPGDGGTDPGDGDPGEEEPSTDGEIPGEENPPTDGEGPVDSTDPPNTDIEGETGPNPQPGTNSGNESKPIGSNTGNTVSKPTASNLSASSNPNNYIAAASSKPVSSESHLLPQTDSKQSQGMLAGILLIASAMIGFITRRQRREKM